MVKAKKLKEFTIRRRPIVMSFLKKSRMYPKLYGEIGDKAWMERLIIFLVEPKPCRATPRDITAWLKLPEVVEVSMRYHYHHSSLYAMQCLINDYLFG